MRVATKPFNTNYRIPIAQGYVVLNGEQITKVTAIKEKYSTIGGQADHWIVTFHLADGTTHEVRQSEWTKTFVKEVFGEDVA